MRATSARKADVLKPRRCHAMKARPWLLSQDPGIRTTGHAGIGMSLSWCSGEAAVLSTLRLLFCCLCCSIRCTSLIGAGAAATCVYLVVAECSIVLFDTTNKSCLVQVVPVHKSLPSTGRLQLCLAQI